MKILKHAQIFIAIAIFMTTDGFSSCVPPQIYSVGPPSGSCYDSIPYPSSIPVEILWGDGIYRSNNFNSWGQCEVKYDCVPFYEESEPEWENCPPFIIFGMPGTQQVGPNTGGPEGLIGYVLYRNFAVGRPIPCGECEHGALGDDNGISVTCEASEVISNTLYGACQ